jgi:hypothetical protein
VHQILIANVPQRTAPPLILSGDDFLPPSKFEAGLQPKVPHPPRFYLDCLRTIHVRRAEFPTPTRWPKKSGDTSSPPLSCRDHPQTPLLSVNRGSDPALTSRELSKLVSDERHAHARPTGPVHAGFHEATTTLKPVATSGNFNHFSPPQPKPLTPTYTNPYTSQTGLPNWR